MFIFNWLFDKLGYMPKINVEVGMVEIESLDKEPKPITKPVTKPRVAKKPTTRRLSTRKPKAK
jgi:hypothetical protein